ncbi:MAG: arsenic resistance protein [Rubrivivax sp.]|nr:arsenic resistance protein [Rubrivivax sp.]
MQRASLERHQVWIYAAAIALGWALGRIAPALAPGLEAALWPALALLLFATFVQVPLLHLREALADRRFVAATLLGNFVLVPMAVAALLPWLPADAALRLGVALVLLVPCTDWFITFCALGRGDTARAIAVTPLNLLLQLLLLPPLLVLLSGRITGGDALHGTLAEAFAPAAVWPAAALVLGPLAAALVAERWIEAKAGREAWRERGAWAPVPLLALVVALIAGAQAQALGDAAPRLAALLPVFAGYLLLALGLAAALARAWRLPAAQARTLAYGLGTRNSFVVLPLALALPAGWETTALVIVLQSLVELLGMLVFLALLPRWFRG